MSLFTISLFLINLSLSSKRTMIGLSKTMISLLLKRHITCQKRPHQMSNFVLNRSITRQFVVSFWLSVSLLLVSLLLVSFSSKRTIIDSESESKSESESESDSLLGLFWHPKISLIGLFWHVMRLLDRSLLTICLFDKSLLIFYQPI